MTVGEVEKVFFVVDSMLTEMMTAKSAAYHLKYHQRTIRKFCDEGKLIGINVDGRLWVTVESVNEFPMRLDSKPESVAS